MEAVNQVYQSAHSRNRQKTQEKLLSF